MSKDKENIWMNPDHKFVETWGEYKHLREIGEIFSGYYLAQDKKTKEYLVVGGQGKPGDEILTFKPKELVFDPMRNWTDKQIDECQDPVVLQDFEKYFTNITSLENKMRMELDSAIRFYENCKKAGYDQDQGRIVMWLMDKIQDLLVSKKD